MGTSFVQFATRILDCHRPGASFEADFDVASEMIAVARAFRSEGCHVRLSASSLRLHITVPAAYESHPHDRA